MYFGFRNISVDYGKKSVLKNLNLEFKKGSITTILGANGSGKSTLLKTVPGVVTKRSGDVILEDKSLRDYSRKEIAKKIGYLPQINYTPEDIDVRTLVSYGRFPHRKHFGSLSDYDMKVVDETLSQCGLSSFSGRLFHTLSGGERKLVWIAAILARKPEILILDEPITYLDIGHQVEILELIRKIGKKEGLTVLMVLHDINLSARYSDLLAVIKNGAVISTDVPEKILTGKMMEDVYGVGAEIVFDKMHKCPMIIPEALNN